MSHDHARLIRELYAAFNARDVDRVLRSMHPGVDWPNGMEGGRVVGHDAVRDYWARQWSMVDPRVEPVEVRADPADGSVLVEVHQVVRDLAGALLVDQRVRHRYRLEGDTIVRMDIEPVAGA